MHFGLKKSCIRN